MYEEGSWQSHERRKEDEKRTSKGASKIPPAVRIVALLYNGILLDILYRTMEAQVSFIMHIL